MKFVSKSSTIFIQAFGASAEQLEHCLASGIIVWGGPVSSILTDGDLLIKQTRAAETSGLVSVLIEGILFQQSTICSLETISTNNVIICFQDLPIPEKLR